MLDEPGPFPGSLPPNPACTFQCTGLSRDLCRVRDGVRVDPVMAVRADFTDRFLLRQAPELVFYVTCMFATSPVVIFCGWLASAVSERADGVLPGAVGRSRSGRFRRRHQGLVTFPAVGAEQRRGRRRPLPARRALRLSYVA